MSVVSDYPDYSPHVAHADQIAATGVPLLTLATPVINTTGKTIPGNTLYAPGILPVTQIGYEVWIQASTGPAATVPFLRIALQWIDSGSGRNVATDTYYVPCASSVGGFISLGRGPSKANSVAVTVFNLDPAVTATINFVLLQNSRVYPRDTWQWDSFTAAGSTIPGFTLPSLPIDQSVLGVFNAITAAASSPAPFLCGMAPGQLVTLAGNTAGVSPSSISLNVFAQPSSVYTANGIVLQETLTTGAFGFQFIAPSAPLLVTWHNNATSGTLTVSGTLIAQAP